MRTKIVADKTGGKVVELTDAENAVIDAEEQAWADGAVAREASAKITILENLITPRRLRDAVLSEEGKAWLTAKEAEIATERSKL